MEARQLEQYHRLKKAGQWSEASLFRDLLRRTMRAQGIRRRVARESSWRLMLERYPAATGGVPSDAAQNTFRQIIADRDAKHSADTAADSTA